MNYITTTFLVVLLLIAGLMVITYVYQIITGKRNFGDVYLGAERPKHRGTNHESIY